MVGSSEGTGSPLHNKPISSATNHHIGLKNDKANFSTSVDLSSTKAQPKLYQQSSATLTHTVDEERDSESGGTGSSSNSSDDGQQHPAGSSSPSPDSDPLISPPPNLPVGSFTNYNIHDLEGNFIRSVSICSITSTSNILSDGTHNQTATSAVATRQSELSAIVSDVKDHLRFPAPYTYTFRVTHSAIHITGSICYFIAGPTYYPSIDNLFLGGLFFTIGSCGFVIADTMDWWLNNRVGCFCDSSYLLSYETRLESYLDDIHSLHGRLQRSHPGINAVFSIVGSLLYLAGSVCYLPSVLDVDPIMGAYLFIAGSVVVIIAQVWKIIRNIFGNPIQLLTPHTDTAAIGDEVMFPNWSMFAFDLWIACAGFCYLVGSVLFLPSYDGDGFDTIVASNWFVFAGLFYCFGSITMIYRYFYTKEYV